MEILPGDRPSDDLSFPAKSDKQEKSETSPLVHEMGLGSFKLFCSPHIGPDVKSEPGQDIRMVAVDCLQTICGKPQNHE